MRLCLVFLSLHSTWNDEKVGYGEDEAPDPITFDSIQERPLEESQLDKVWVSDCIFSGIEKNRAITYTKQGKLLIESSTFSNCSNNNIGGAIYKLAGDSVLSKCRSVRCYTSGSGSQGYGQFLYSDVSQGDDHKNKVFECSISESMPQQNKPSHWGPVDLRNGNILVETVNITNNYIQFYSGIHLSMSTSCSINFCTFNYNRAQIQRLIMIEIDNTQYEMNITYTNILNNREDGSAQMIRTDGPTKIFHCCIMNNTIKNLFDGYKDIGAKGHIVVIDCAIDVDPSDKCTGNVDISQWRADSSFILPIKCYEKSGYCQASYDSIYDLTAITPVENAYIQTLFEFQKALAINNMFIVIALGSH